jgi:hypothetical protein
MFFYIIFIIFTNVCKKIQESAITADDTNPTLSALQNLARRYGALDINDQPTASTPTKAKISRDALDIPLPSTPSTPQSDSQALVVADTPTITPPEHLMSIQSITRQIGELEKDATCNTSAVELITAILESMLQVLPTPNSSREAQVYHATS